MDMSTTLRSYLYVPCDKARMIDKSLILDSDAVIFDLEDAVAGSRKQIARENLVSRTTAIKASNKPTLVRVNGVDSPFFSEDLAACLDVGVCGIVVPKADADALRYVDKEISSSTSRNRDIRIIPLIETAYALETISEIVTVSDRIAAAQFGAEDFTEDLGIERTVAGDEISYARNRFAIACRGRGKGAVDTPCTDFYDSDTLLRDIHRARAAGMTGKTCIHPSQIAVVNDAFLPSEKEVIESSHIWELWKSAMSAGDGTVVYHGKMIDRPIAMRAERVVNIAKRHGLTLSPDSQYYQAQTRTSGYDNGTT